MALPIIIIVGALFLSAFGIYAIMLQERRKKTQVKTDALAKVAKNYRFLNENFLTRKAFRKIVEQIAGLAIYDFWEIRTLAVQYYTQTIALCTCLVMVGVIVFQDVTATLLCFLFAMVMFQSLITKKLDNVHFLVLKEFSTTLSSIREAYTLYGNIPDAIKECTHGKYLQRTLDKIYLILTSTEREEHLEEFYQTVPFPMLQTLAGVCVLLDDAGDEQDEKGVSAFKSAITLLKNECDLDVRKLTKQRLMFSFLEYLPLAPVPFVGVLEWFFIKFMPGTSVLYNGMLGYLSQTLIIVSATYSYWYITSTNSPTAIRRSDRSDIIVAFMNWAPIKQILPNIVPKRFRTRLKIERMLQGALSEKDINYIYASKLLISGSLIVATFLGLLAFTALARDFAYDNIRTASFLGGTQLTVEQAQRIKEMDDYILAQPKAPRERDLQDLIPTYVPGLSAMDLKDQCTRVIKKYNDYHNLRFHWWYLLVAYLVGIVGWFIPEMMVDLRKKMVLTEEEEDVLQLQTMLAILRYTSLDTMAALYWLAKQSRIYRTAILFAYHEYPSDPELALNRLKSKSKVAEFQQICERLLSTVSQVTLKEAFADLESERDHMLRIREMVQNNTIEAKRRRASPLSRAPLYIMLVGHVLVPICVLGATEMISLMGQLGVL